MRIRIKFHKTEAMRFTGHLDLHQTWERVFRRAVLPLAYSQGFHPQPRINLACALPLGFTSECEVLDVWIEKDMALTDVEAAIQPALPPGLRLGGLEEVDIRLPALQTQVESSEFVVTFLDQLPDLSERIAALLAAEHLPRQRSGKDYDLRVLVEAVHELPADDEGLRRYQIRLASRPGATGRPEEFVSALGLDPFSVRVHRVQLHFAA